MRDRFLQWLRPATYLRGNFLTLFGAALTTSTAITLVAVWLLESTGRSVHPYAGLVIFVGLPALFVLGLVLMPLGVLLERRKLRARGETLPTRVDFGSAEVLRALSIVGLLTAVNIALLGIASYKGIEHMESTSFCGATCHVVMQPEYTAFQVSPHARVACVECHVGSGASWFVRSKIAGVRQLIGVTTGHYSRPIPAPVRPIRPPSDTCEHCHNPQTYAGTRLKVVDKFADDETNSRSNTVLMLKVGGLRAGTASGIHGHHLNGGRITYIATDDKRQVIPRVTVTDASGHATEYTSTEIKATDAELQRSEHRVMDCLDCHNRVGHAFAPPERALDRALASGQISHELPFVKREALRLVKAEYADHDRAGQAIDSELTAFYRDKYPDVFKTKQADVRKAIDSVRQVYTSNIFPAMKVGWSTYPNNVGHEEFPGCFRCHDGNHAAPDGRVISQDCDSCHNVLAMEEAGPQILKDLGLAAP
jgi:nitrate/TMAO reductase-like tetraheme cytochrome c subunit